MDYTTLVIGPGGNKGYTYLGQLLYLSNKGYLNRIDKYIGVSVGSVISLLMCCGYTTLEIVTEAQKVNIIDIECINSPGDILRNFSIFSQEKLEKQLVEVVEKKLKSVPTLQELYTLTGKEYISVATCVSDKMPYPEYISYKNFPNMSCVKAAMFSSCIPIVFSPCEYNDKSYVDGGISNPYPIDLCFKEDRNVIALSLLSYPSSSNQYILQCLQAPTSQLRTRIIDAIPEEMRDRFLHIQSIITVNPTGSFIVGDDEKSLLFDQGYEQTKDHFNPKSIMRCEEVIYDN